VVSEPVEAFGKDAQAAFLDSGLLGALLGATAGAGREGPFDLGPLLETFVFSEVLKQTSWSVRAALLYTTVKRSGRG